MHAQLQGWAHKLPRSHLAALRAKLPLSIQYHPQRLSQLKMGVRQHVNLLQVRSSCHATSGNKHDSYLSTCNVLHALQAHGRLALPTAFALSAHAWATNASLTVTHATTLWPQ